MPPHFDRGESAYFLAISRNKKSVTLDLRTDEGRALLHRLVVHADVIDLTELREVLGMDASTEDDSASTPAQGEALSNFKPETTSPNALALSQRWRHLGGDGL